MGSAANGHRSDHADGRIHQDLQCPHTEQQPQTASTQTTSRHFEAAASAAALQLPSAAPVEGPPRPQWARGPRRGARRGPRRAEAAVPTAPATVAAAASPPPAPRELSDGPDETLRALPPHAPQPLTTTTNHHPPMPWLLLVPTVGKTKAVSLHPKKKSETVVKSSSYPPFLIDNGHDRKHLT